MDESKLWHSLKEFLIHVAVGAIVFVFISCIAILLSEWVKILDKNGYDPIIVKGLSGFEYFLFGMDLLLSGIFLIRSMIKLVKELW